MQDFDAIVVGVGPTGATLAGLLAQRGLRVAAFDQLPGLYPLPRAIGFDHETMRIVQELGIAERVLPFTAEYRPSEYRGIDGGLIKRLDMAPPPHRLGWAPNYVFDQPAFEHELRRRLAELPGVHAAYSTEVLSFVDHGDMVSIDTRAGAGRTSRFRAKYLIACDGGSSPIRKALGIELEDLGFDEPWLVVDASINDDKLAELPHTQVQYCEPERPCTFVIGPGNHRRWEITLLPGDSLSESFPDEELWPLLSRWIKPGDGKLRRAAAYRFHGLIARQWRKGRVLLAGDAAHMTPPFMAQGMVQGLRDAQNLAWKLARVLHGESSDALLDTYGSERRPHVETTTRGAISLGRVICERDPVKARERDAAMRAESGGEIRTTIRQTMVPGLLQGSLVSETPGAGQLCPQPRVRSADGSAALLDDLTGACVRVISIAPLDNAGAATLAEQLPPLQGRVIAVDTAAPPQRCLTVQELQPVMRPWLHSLQRGIAIVRPDHYVYGTAASIGEAVALLDRLRTQLD